MIPSLYTLLAYSYSFIHITKRNTVVFQITFIHNIAECVPKGSPINTVH